MGQTRLEKHEYMRRQRAALDEGFVAIAEVHHSGRSYALSGRVVARRDHTHVCFFDLRDETGTLQMLAARSIFMDRLEDIDVGDIMQFQGITEKSKASEDVILRVTSFQILTKALQPPPDRINGVTDVGTRARFPELGYMTKDTSWSMLQMRGDLTEAIRRHMNGHGFREVETPILQATAGGAVAKPFETHHNALGSLASMRISTELYLNRLMIGGLERVYELGRCFRNEGMSHTHNPEFTMLEWGQAYTDYYGICDFTEGLVRQCAGSILGTLRIPSGALESRFRRITFDHICEEILGENLGEYSSYEMRVFGVDTNQHMSWGEAATSVYTHRVEPKIIEPTFVFEFPSDPHPITRRVFGHADRCEHADLVINGIEILSADTEITDPVLQRELLAGQSKRPGNEIHEIDEDYLKALEYGLPPSATGGLGVDRLLMVLLGEDNIRNVLPFPIVKEKTQ